MSKQTIKLEQIYNAPIEKVWKALTDKDLMKQWYFDIEDFELKEGAVFNFYESDARQYHHRVEIKKIISGRLLQHTWTHPSHSKGESMLRWELIPDGANTRVTLTHEGLENFEENGPEFAVANYEMGWKEIMGKSLNFFLEG